MGWTIEYALSVRKTVRKMDRSTRDRIRSFLEQRVASLKDPRELGSPLKGDLSDFWRYRVGDYRVICELHDDTLTVLVVRIGHRGEVYR